MKNFELSIIHFTPVDSLAKLVYIVMDCFVIAALTIIGLFIYMILSKFVYLLYISEIKVGIEGIETLTQLKLVDISEFQKR